MLDGCIVVLDAEVTHSSAPSYVRRSVEQTGHAAEQRALAKHHDFKDAAGGAASYQIVPLAMNL